MSKINQALNSIRKTNESSEIYKENCDKIISNKKMRISDFQIKFVTSNLFSESLLVQEDIKELNETFDENYFLKEELLSSSILFKINV